VSDNLTLTAILGFCASLGAYAFQKWRDREEQIRSRHFDVYVEMVESICGLGNAHNRNTGIEDALSRYSSAKMKFAVVASDNVMKKFVAFDRLVTNFDKDTIYDFDRRLGEFMLAARRENLGKSFVGVDDLIIITPYGKSLRGK
jgi:hypothetical protein